MIRTVLALAGIVIALAAPPAVALVEAGWKDWGNYTGIGVYTPVGHVACGRGNQYDNPAMDLKVLGTDHLSDREWNNGVTRACKRHAPGIGVGV